MVLLPLVEATLRKLLHTGISGSSSIVQHLTLIIGVMGGAGDRGGSRRGDDAALRAIRALDGRTYPFGGGDATRIARVCHHGRRRFDPILAVRRSHRLGCDRTLFAGN